MQVQTSFLIQRALALIGVKASGNQLKGEQANNALFVLNEIGDSLNSDLDLVYAMQTQTAPLANGVVQADNVVRYTIGPGSNVFTPTFNVATRPQEITFASFQMINTGVPFLDRPIKIIGPEEWQAIRVKSITSQVSFYLYYDKQWPVGNLFLWPQPNIHANLSIMTEVALPGPLDMTTIINLPPGYERLLRYELAINLAPEYNKPVPTDVAAILSGIKQQLKVTNLRSRELSYSHEAQGSRQSGAYDVYTDEVY